MEEVVAVLAVFADQGIKGQKAGTAFSMVLRDLTSKAIKNSAEFKSMGIEVFDVKGEFRGFAPIVQQMEGAFGGLSDEQLRSSLIMLGFTDRSVAATSALLGTSAQLFAYEESLNDAGGTMEEVADKQLESFNAKITLLGNTMKDIAVGAGEKFNEFLNSLGENEDLQQLADGILEVGKALKPVLEGFGNIARVVAGLGIGGLVKLLAGVGETLATITPLANALAIIIGVKLVSAVVRVGGAMGVGSGIAARYGEQMALANMRALQAAGGNQALAASVSKTSVAMTTLGHTGKAALGSLTSGMTNFAKSMASPMGAIILVTFMVANWKKQMQEAKDAAAEMFAPLSQAADEADNFSDFTGAVNDLSMASNEAGDSLDDYRGGILGTVRALGDNTHAVAGFDNKLATVTGTYQEIREQAEAARQEHEKWEGALNAMIPAFNATEREVQNAADALGVDLRDGIREGSKDWLAIQSHIESVSYTHLRAHET